MVIIAASSYRRAGNAVDAKDLLDLAVKRSYNATWPYPIITYLRGELTVDALVAWLPTTTTA